MICAKELYQYNKDDFYLRNFMNKASVPPFWIIAFIAGLPLFAETVYTPSLPDIARVFKVSESMAEYTLTIYIFGMAAGILFWGHLSDRIGRKPCVLAGLFFFILGCIGCYFSESIHVLMFCRLAQAFGGSVGNVLAQSIARDAFQGASLGRLYSVVASSLAIFPAVGPVIGGHIAEYLGWNDIFLFLIFFALVLGWSVIKELPETHKAEDRKPISFMEVLPLMIKDKKVIGFSLLVASSNGLGFCYFAEAPFYLINLLGLRPSEYGFTFIAVAISAMFGGLCSAKLQGNHKSKSILGYGLLLILISGLLFSLIILYSMKIEQISNFVLIIVVVAGQMIITFGRGLVNANALALALVDYKWCVGTASSLFGCFYYFIISLFTFGMGVLHNGTLLPMPLYFLAIGLFMMLVRKVMIRG